MVTAIPPLVESEKLEFGQPPGATESAPKTSLVIASYNIRYARGPHLISGGIWRKLGHLDISARPQLVNKHVKAAARVFSEGALLPRIDVLALQEADTRTQRSGGRHVAADLAHELEMRWVHAPAGIPRGIKPVKRQWWLDFEEPIGLHDNGDTGVALLSSIPFVDVTRIDLPWHECPWRPRLAMAATLKMAQNALRLFNVHVDPHAAAGGQLEQLEVLLGHANESTLPTLVVGDFNTLSDKKCRETRRFLESHDFVSALPTGTATWRGGGIRLHADWIFSRGVRVKRWGVAKLAGISDHWPIWAEVDFEVR